MKSFLVTIIFVAACYSSHAQIGGLATFEFLNLTQSARSTALGGYMIAINDADVNLMFSNPALLQKEMHHQLAVNHNFHFAGISHGFAAYGIHIEKWQMTFSAGANYIDYGDFMRADISSQVSGVFTAKENSLTIGAAKTFDERLSLGLNLKFINSTLESYSAIGGAMDIGINYQKPENRSSWSLVLKNIGLQLNTFDLVREPLPFEVQMGWSKRLEHLPFRLSITAHHLNRWNLISDNLVEDDPIFTDPNNQNTPSGNNFVDNFFRHLVFGGELILGSNGVFRLRAGYNHQMRRELSSSAFRSFSGFSYGFGLKVKKIRFDYALANYHLAGSTNHLSLIIDLENLVHKL